MTAQVNISYDSQSKQISYETDGETHLISLDCVLGVQQKSQGETSLLYVEGSSADATVFKALPITSTPSNLPNHLTSPSPFTNLAHNISVIVSTASGSQNAAIFFANALSPLLAHLGHPSGSYTVHTTSSSDSITSLIQSTLQPSANTGTPHTIILLAGDGGVIDIVNSLTTPTHPRTPNYRSPTIILLPMGTGNALAHSSNITSDSTHGLSTLFRGTSHRLPLFTARFSAVSSLDQQPLPAARAYTIHGAVVCSWGLHAALVADSDTPEYRRHGVARFQMAAKENLYPADGSDPHEYRGRVSILPRGGQADWQVVPRERHAYVLATMVAQLEAGFTISPRSEPLDGQLRLVHFGPLEGGGDEVMRIMGLAYQCGKHVAEEVVGYEEVDAVRVEFDEQDARWRRVCVDGKIVTAAVGSRLEVSREELDVLNLYAM